MYSKSHCRTPKEQSVHLWSVPLDSLSINLHFAAAIMVFGIQNPKLCESLQVQVAFNSYTPKDGVHSKEFTS